jgi:hypothetical protein
VGNDQIGRSSDRFFYLSNVNPNNDGNGYHFGLDQSHYVTGYSVNRYANTDITWEKATTANLGMDLSFKNGINVVVDAFRSVRSNILMQRTNIPTTMGLETGVQANVLIIPTI